MTPNNALQRNVIHRGQLALAMDFALAGLEIVPVRSTRSLDVVHGTV